MEELFTTQISQGAGSMAYRVVFDQEQYQFIPNGFEGSSFAFRREHDEWHPVEPLPETVQDQAVEALEKYLLSQH
ncbi:hypothetical protein SAMN05444008_113101 [Cnuella takakiae]|uniref:Uncharacterized protein n=1 Tax=Cnuella takakiae TaxID=1302690 RepID=A0A1M5FAW5_9BACT|nr:hypothetical protein [Cnuella takakiae]OLY91024.1 hypothetical protein BUE76_03260 [Cnuella takakiae]SHF88211.1 hypothetical protein SAMN05444008_113101 [Cnuella takakiae]